MAETPELLPLVVGVTGHRNLRPGDRDALEGKVREIFRGLRQRVPHSPLALLSPLAEGADRLVTRVAIAEGIPVIAALPMERGRYEEDFSDPASREEFRGLLRSARLEYALTPPPGEGGTPRDQAYSRVGAHVASHCQVLIALWDGRESCLEGGTAQVVKFKLEGVPANLSPGESLHDLPDRGPVLQVVTPRAGQEEPAGKLTLVELFPGDGAEQAASRSAFDKVLGCMDAFNRDGVALYPSLADRRAESRSYLMSDSEAESLPPLLRSDLERYAVSDTLAQHFRQKTHRTLFGLLAAVFVLASLFQAHVFFRQAYKLGDNGPRPWHAQVLIMLDRPGRVYLTPLDVIYLTLLCVTIAAFQRARRGDFQSKYLDYRSVAEGLRVQFFWHIAGLPDSAADYYLRKQRGELDWIRNAVRISGLGGRARAAEAGAHPDGSTVFVKERWVDDQARFFTKRAAVSLRQSRRVRTVTHYSFYAGLAFLVARTFAPPDHPLIIALVMVLALALILSVYAKVTAFSEHAKQYGRMSLLFTRASHRLERLIRTREPAGPEDLLRELGRESLAENGDWVLLHRERPLELPRV